VWLLLGALAAAGVYQLVLWPGFHLRGIAVNGTSVVSRADVIHHAALDRTRNIWLQDMRAATTRIEAIPWVDRAYIHRFLPASVSIDIVEREASACVVAHDGARFTVDASARVLEGGCGRITQPVIRIADIQGVPSAGAFVHSVSLAQLQRDAVTLDGIEPGEFVRFDFDRFDQLEATMRSGLTVEFGDDGDLPAKVSLLDSILKSSSLRRAGLRAVDLRAPEAPVADYR
jgi:hypothetical protein